MISTRNGKDVFVVSNLNEAGSVLTHLYESSSLSKNEITNIVSFNGLSVADTVRCYNAFIREEGAKRHEISIFKAA